MIKLGLLGNNISKSEMPNLITKLGNEFGFEIKYKLFDQALKTNFNLKKIIYREGCHLEEADPPCLSGSTWVVLRAIDVAGELLGTLRWGP